MLTTGILKLRLASFKKKKEKLRLANVESIISLVTEIQLRR